MKLDPDEKELVDSVECGEWKSAKGGKRERARYSRYAKATFERSTSVFSKDLEAIQKRALAEGLPYQTLISSLLHKYATGPAQRDLTSAAPRLCPAAAYSTSVSVPVAISAAAQITSRFIQARRRMPTPSFSNTSTATNAVTAK